MTIKTGYLYHIKDEFFEKFSNYNLMKNHEKGKTRPTYFTIKEQDILWFIPLSTKVEKYQKLIDIKTKKYGYCNTILIREILNRKHAILIQNAFPTLEKYIDHIHVINGNPVKVIETVKNDILKNFEDVMNEHKHGINLFFADINKMLKALDQELIKN